jgi:hypothetical protein
VPAYGFAIIGAPGNDTVGATVAIRGIPNSYYTMRLIQGPADCHTVDWAGFTNASGNATVHLSEPSVSSTAFVAIDQYATFGDVVAEIEFALVTETYHH